MIDDRKTNISRHSTQAMRALKVATMIALVGPLLACNSEEQREEARRSALEGDASPSSLDGLKARVSLAREFDEDAARDAAHDALAGLTYEDSEGSAACTDDCAGHNAGWQHAQEDGGNDCDGGESESFEAGCHAYGDAVERKVESAKEAFDGGDDAFLKTD